MCVYSSHSDLMSLADLEVELEVHPEFLSKNSELRGIFTDFILSNMLGITSYDL